MKKFLDCNFPRERGTVTELIFGCFDRRFRGFRGQLAKAAGFETAYPMLLPGGPKDLVFPTVPRDAEYLLEKLDLMISHGIRKLYVMVHNECLACDSSTDMLFYQDVLRRAKRILQNRFPSLEIVLLLADFDGIYLIEEETADASGMLSPALA